MISVSYRIPKQEFEKGTPEVAPDEAVANADQEVAEGLCNSLSSSIVKSIRAQAVMIKT